MPSVVDQAKVLIEESLESSAIDSILYDTDEQELTVTFESGQVYSYKSVPRYTVTMLRRAKSKGRFFQSYIRPRYEYVRETKEHLQHCARCGQDHEIVWMPFKDAPIDDYTHWGLCPLNSEPVLMKEVPDV